MTQDKKILALGGAGGMGQLLVRTLVNKSNFSELRIADRDLNAARSFATTFNDPRITADRVDVTNKNELYTALKSADLVVSTIGPYYRFGTFVLKAAIETRTHYLDICDDWQPTQEMLALNEEAKKAGITAVIGAGASPGISNLLAVKAANELEQVDVLHTLWGTEQRVTENDTVENSAALYHWLAMLTGKIKLYRDNNWVMEKPLKCMPINFPGIGNVKVYTLGHPEPISLPLQYPGIKESVNAMDLPNSVVAILKTVSRKIDNNIMSLDAGVDYVGKLFSGNNDISAGVALKEGFRHLWNNSVEVISRKKYLPGVAAYALGTIDGKTVRVGTSLKGKIQGGMSAVTGIPAAIMAGMILEGEIRERGAYAPEKGVDPDTFFSKLAAHTTKPDNTLSPVNVARSI